MHQIGFLEGEEAFDFTDPKDVIRAVHLIPRFAGPRISYLLGPSIARREEEGDLDYKHYFVNMFVDRDMFVCYTGGGIGHRATREATCSLSSDVELAYRERGLNDSKHSDDGIEVPQDDQTKEEDSEHSHFEGSEDSEISE
ncbi:hypothetical protein C0991_001497, partial [Blastosporella zonata]